jgi:Mg/Co/Ni transporter MgtE
MLVGAGGNAGNQASVRIIRGIAVGTLNDSTVRKVLLREMLMAVSISCLLGVVGLLRAISSSETSISEVVAITFALLIIVFSSIVVGAVLPLVLKYFHIDPAHSSTTIQVVMDISGVLITCFVATALLETSWGKLMILNLGLM